MFKIILAGGSGLLGTALARSFHPEGHEVVVLSRNPEPAPWRTVGWDGRTLGDWANEIDGADVVINLAGKSVNCRYTKRNRHEIVASRIESTRVVGEAIARAAKPPRVWLQMSTGTMYAHRYDTPNNEITGILGGHELDVPPEWRFSVGVGRAWEEAVDKIPTPHTRRVKMRAAIVMSPDPRGAFNIYMNLVRLGLGGKHGDGRQFVSWIHERDYVRAVRFLIEHDEIDDVVNVGAPHPITNAGFMKGMRDAIGIRFGLPATEWMLTAAAFVHRTEVELLLKSRYTVPKRLLDAGFQFEFPTWPEAARDLCEGWKKQGKEQRS